MQFSRAMLLCTFLVVLIIAGETSLADDEADFRPVTDFLKLPEGWTLGSCSAVGVNGRGEILLLHRGKHPLIVFDASGRFLRSWGDELIQSPHGLRVDRDNNVWVTDIGGHRVFKFDPSGKLLLSLGNGKPGAGDDQFNKPTDVAFGPDGEFFVADGYGNARVLRFAASGKLVRTWGAPGTGPGEFDLPHMLSSDADGNLFVAEVGGKRLQKFVRK